MTEKPDIQEHHCYVIKVYHERSSNKWFAVVTKDAIRVYKTTKWDSKLYALMAAWKGMETL